MAQANQSRTETPVVVNLTGDAGVDSAGRIRDTLLAAVAGARDLTIDVSGLSFADIAFFQLLYSAMLSLEAAGGKLRIAGLGQSVAAEAAQACGFFEAAWFARLTGQEAGGGDARAAKAD